MPTIRGWAATGAALALVILWIGFGEELLLAVARLPQVVVESCEPDSRGLGVRDLLLVLRGLKAFDVELRHRLSQVLYEPMLVEKREPVLVVVHSSASQLDDLVANDLMDRPIQIGSADALPPVFRQ